MERLEATIDQYGRWSELRVYIDRIKAYLDTDFSMCVENSSALLDSICKEICQDKGVVLRKSPDVHETIKKAFLAIGYEAGDPLNQISRAFSNIGRNVHDLRRKDGATAHGMTLSELKKRNEAYSELTKEFLINSIESTALFLIKSFETENPRATQDNSELPVKEGTDLDFFECDDFNTSWDDIHGDFEMGEYAYTASEILFNVDIEAYSTEYRAYQEAPND